MRVSVFTLHFCGMKGAGQKAEGIFETMVQSRLSNSVASANQPAPIVCTHALEQTCKPT